MDNHSFERLAESGELLRFSGDTQFVGRVVRISDSESEEMPHFKIEQEPEACWLCLKNPAEGHATIGDLRYCHGDDDEEPTCYQRASNPFYGSAITEHLVAP